MKYCVLCGAEHRDTVTTCATCQALLVRSLDSEEVRANSPRLLWVGKDLFEFELVASAVRDAEIPALVEERPAGMLGSLVRSHSRIHVLSDDFHRALSAAASAIADRGRIHNPKQTCHACGVPCSAFLAACPSCEAILIVEPKKERESLAVTPPGEPTAMKYCPLCDAEYSTAHEQCTVCGVDLVPEELRGRPLDERQRKERIEVVWRGGDPAAISEVIHTLRETGIRHHVQPTNDHMVFELGMPRPKYAVRVFSSDAVKAKELLADIRETPVFALSETPGFEDEAATPPLHANHRWNAAAATVEIWSGEDAALAQVLEDCLRENRIGVRRGGRGPGLMRLSVMSQDEAAAREIVREVRDASPPA
jgi:hypothetical protein